MNYCIRIFKYADWFAPGTTVFDHAYGRHESVKICLAGFLIQGNGRNIMVDTGMDGIDLTYTVEDQKKWDHLGASRNTSELIAKIGLALDDIDTVVITHLHFDHYMNAALYPRARFLVPRKEWEHVHNPLLAGACPEVGFPREPLSWMNRDGGQWVELVDDSHMVAPGITMHWTGGHSPGHMVVKVSTDQGPAIVVGDAFYLYEHIDKDIPLGYRTNVEELMAGYRWLREQNAMLLPAHDYAIFDRYPEHQIGTPDQSTNEHEN